MPRGPRFSLTARFVKRLLTRKTTRSDTFRRTRVSKTMLNVLWLVVPLEATH